MKTHSLGWALAGSEEKCSDIEGQGNMAAPTVLFDGGSGEDAYIQQKGHTHAVLDKVTKVEIDEGRTRRFGRSNPEVMNVVFWRAMVEAHISAYDARRYFTQYDFNKGESAGTSGENAMVWSDPVWCNKRVGATTTRLPDGTQVQIGGEHEDFYDPDFVIYNDVIVYKPESTRSSPKFTIYGYPKEVFPPTDFHTASYSAREDAIFIIGSTASSATKDNEYETLVYRLTVGTWKMEKVDTAGSGPGTIWGHVAELKVKGGRDQSSEEEEMWVKGGVEEGVCTTHRYVKDRGHGKKEIEVEETERWILDLKTRTWRFAHAEEREGT